LHQSSEPSLLYEPDYHGSLSYKTPRPRWRL